MTLPFVPETISRWPIARLVPYAGNAKTHGADQVAKIAASMAEFGWTAPVLVADDGEIIAGHGRVLAAEQLGLGDVPVIVLGHLTEAQRRAYRIADNKLTELGAWDEAKLADELQALGADGFDLSLTGFDDNEIERLMASLDGDGDEAGDGDAGVPEPPVEPVSRPGDLWVCGEHRVLCGDATVLSDVETLLGGELADMTFCDPPYNVNYGDTPKDKLRAKGGTKAGRTILNDNLGSDFAALLYDASVNILAVTKGAVYICMSSSELDTLQKAFRDAGGKWSTFIVWAKNTFTLGRSDYQRQYEPILYGWKDGAEHYWCGARNQGDVWFFDKPHKNDLHPTMKPVALVERAIRNSSKGRDIVLDPFGGSGTTMIAAERSGRRARLVELDPKYVDVIVGRWQAVTGKAATLSSDGSTFASHATSGPTAAG